MLSSNFSQSGYSMDGSALCGRSILVVEAEPFAALDVEIGLREAGAKVFGARQLKDALYMAEYPALSAAWLLNALAAPKPPRSADDLHTLACRLCSTLDTMRPRPNSNGPTFPLSLSQRQPEN